MLQFKPITGKDEAKIRRYLSLSPSKQLVDCFEAFYLWRDVLHVEWAEAGGSAIFKVHYDSVCPQFLFPFGTGDPSDLFHDLKMYCAAQGYPLRLAKLRKEQLLYLEKAFPGTFVAEAHRDHAEYLFTTETFLHYSGKALQPKRNFVNYARKNYDWTFERLEEHNLAECRAFASKFDGDASFEDDSQALRNALDDFGELQLKGGLIRIGAEIAALFICTLLGDGETAAGLFLRGDHEKKGVIPLLYQIYFLHYPEFRYFNFGEDLGVEGLRKNKLSFQPMELLELYEVNFL